MAKNKLYSKTIKVNEISIEERRDMFAVFSKYYDNVTEEVFNKDLAAKDVAFLLLDQKENKIRGFSTLVSLNFKRSNGEQVRGLFSGDTIVEKDFWGQGTLGVAFLKYLFMEKVKNPFKPLYWFLISKGFKTYLLMANNFSNHWPRYEGMTPAPIKEVIDSFATQLYQNNYRSELGLIKFEQKEEKDSLKLGVAPITRKMIEENPRIAFFSEKNPEWEFGDELCCLAEMTLTMPFKYQSKIIKKQFSKSLAKGRARALALFGLGYDERG